MNLLKQKQGKMTKLPAHIQFDTVSPATKLLEKRRKMYEVHEAFEAQKEEFKKYEMHFEISTICGMLFMDTCNVFCV